MVQLVVSARDEEAEGSEKWHRKVSAEELRKVYSDWPTHLKDAVDKVHLLTFQSDHDAVK